MQPPRYILLKATPDGDLALFGCGLEPLSQTEISRAAERYILNTLNAGGEPDTLYRWQVRGAPDVIDADSIEEAGA